MNDKHWIKYYNGKQIMPPSDFACFAYGRISRGAKILEVGAGDGRDTGLLKDRGEVYAIEPANKTSFEKMGVPHFHGTFEQWLNLTKDSPDYKPDYIYARWFLHSVPQEIERELFDYAEKHNATLMLEFRAIGDDVPDDGHERRPLDPYDVVEQLVARGYIITHFDVDYDLSKNGNNNPYLARVIAEHKRR